MNLSIASRRMLFVTPSRLLQNHVSAARRRDVTPYLTDVLPSTYALYGSQQTFANRTYPLQPTTATETLGRVSTDAGLGTGRSHKSASFVFPSAASSHHRRREAPAPVTDRSLEDVTGEVRQVK